MELFSRSKSYKVYRSINGSSEESLLVWHIISFIRGKLSKLTESKPIFEMLRNANLGHFKLVKLDSLFYIPYRLRIERASALFSSKIKLDNSTGKPFRFSALSLY